MPLPLRRSFLACLLALAALAAPGPGGWAAVAAEEPRAFIDQLGNRTVEILSAETPIKERERELREVLRQAFDLETIGRLVLGHLWRQATPEQRAQYSEVFADFVVQTYARQLAENEVKSFAITGVKTLNDTDTLIETVVERPRTEPTRFGWRVRDKDAALKIVDVVVEGVSLVVSRRSEFASVVQRDGMDALIQSLRTKLS